MSGQDSRRGWIWLLLALVSVVVLGTLVGRTFYGERPLRQHEFSGSTMGTTWSLKVVLPDGAPEKWVMAFLDTTRSRLARVEGLMSTWDPDSELSRLNRFADTVPHAVSPETFAVLSIARDVGSSSDGALDVTVAPLVEAWGFGPSGRDASAGTPDDAALAALAAHVGADRFRLDDRDETVAKSAPEVVLDVSAVAKGYAVDQAAEGLVTLGAKAFAIEVGGEVRVRGTRADGTAWRVAIEAPTALTRAVSRVLDLRDVAVATSGDYRNFFELDGVRFAHIIDPRTSRPVPWQGFSVTVAHREAAYADAWATALCVLGPKEGLRVAEENGIAALFLFERDGSMEERASPAMQRRLTEPGV